MSDRLKRWLKEELVSMVGVHLALIDPPAEIVSRTYPADIRVLLWTGVLVNIYVLMEPLKPRTLKQIIHHDTGEGIGVLFIVAPHLVPAPRAQFTPPEWLFNLHMLNNERIYTYSPEDREMALLQIHFERLDATERYEAIYGPEVKLERLHYGRVVVKPRAIKGKWLTAHFGHQAFWQHERLRFFMPPPRRPETENRGPTAGNGASSAAHHEKNRLERSYEILGVRLNATQEEVKIAFRQRVFSVHPDVSALPKVMAEEKFRMLAEAYEFIKSERGWS